MNKKWTLIVVILALIVPMALTACGDDDKDEGSSAAKLSQTFTGPTTGITVQYPDGWAAAEGEDGSVMIANSQATLDKLVEGGEENNPTGDDYGVIVFALPLAMLGDPVPSQEEIFAMFTGGMADEGEDTTVSDTKSIKLGDKDALRVDITDNEADTEGFFVGYMTADSYVMVAAAAAKGKVSSQEATALKIAESVSVVVPEPTE